MKLPVIKAVGASFAYIASNAGRLVAALWLPALLLTAIVFYATPGYLDAVMAFEGAAEDPASFAPPPEMFRSMGLLMGSSMLFYPMMAVASVRHLVRGDALKRPFYVAFGGDELRVLAGYALLLLMMMGVYIVGALGVLAVAAALSVISKEAGGAAAAIAMLAFIVGLCWFMLRLSLIVPAAVATRTVGVAQSWRASKGAAWALFFYWVIGFFVFIVLMTPFWALLFAGAFGFYGDIIKAGADEAASAEAQRRLIEWQRQLYDPSNAGFWPLIVGTWLYTMLTMAATNVYAGVAWRYLAGESSPPPARNSAALDATAGEPPVFAPQADEPKPDGRAADGGEERP